MISTGPLFTDPGEGAATDAHATEVGDAKDR